MRFDIVTIFPGFFDSVFAHGIVRRALKEGLVTVEAHDLREYAHDRHRTVDDRPFGGGEGMVLKPEPLAEALEALGVRAKTERERSDSESEKQNAGPRSTSSADAFFAQGRLSTSVAAATSAQDDNSADETRVILLSAQGRLFTQAVARELATLERVVLVCGRYEGVDERVNELYCDMELSVGDYVLSGGEPAAAVVVDATMRLIPGVLGNEASSEFESFGVPDAEITTDEEGIPRSQHGAGGPLDYPHYTRPAEFAGLKVPEPLLNGDHQAIRRWRREQQLRKTLANRPDLLENAVLLKKDRDFLESLRRQDVQGESEESSKNAPSS